MKDISKILYYLLGVPKSIRFNFHYFRFSTAIKLPVLLTPNVKMTVLKGKVELPMEGLKTGLIRIGDPMLGIFKKGEKVIWQNSGKVVFRGRTHFGQGCSISVNEEGVLDLGGNFLCTGSSHFVVSKSLAFGADCLVAWQCLFMDTDFHKILNKDGIQTNENRPINIGDHVWVGCRSTILKGVSIPAGCVIAEGSNVVSSLTIQNSIIGGNPAKIIKEDISWER